jgi:hypothetical protein
MTAKKSDMTLDYAKPKEGFSRVSATTAALIIAPLVMLLIEFSVLVFDVTYGDPPDIVEFFAYHAVLGLVVLLAICWLALVVRRARKQRRWWVILCAALWCFVICWFAIEFLREVNAHPAAKDYWAELQSNQAPEGNLLELCEYKTGNQRFTTFDFE